MPFATEESQLIQSENKDKNVPSCTFPVTKKVEDCLLSESDLKIFQANRKDFVQHIFSKLADLSQLNPQDARISIKISQNQNQWIYSHTSKFINQEQIKQGQNAIKGILSLSLVLAPENEMPKQVALLNVDEDGKFISVDLIKDGIISKPLDTRSIRQNANLDKLLTILSGKIFEYDLQNKQPATNAKLDII